MSPRATMPRRRKTAVMPTRRRSRLGGNNEVASTTKGAGSVEADSAPAATSVPSGAPPTRGDVPALANPGMPPTRASEIAPVVDGGSPPTRLVVTTSDGGGAPPTRETAPAAAVQAPAAQPPNRLTTWIEETEQRVSTLETVEGQKWVFLSAPLTSTSWDGDAKSTTAKTKIDLSAVFSAPANIKAALVRVVIQDSGASSTDCWLMLAPNDTAASGVGIRCLPADDRYADGSLIVPCNSDGDVYYQINASGSGTMDVFLQIWGYVV